MELFLNSACCAANCFSANAWDITYDWNGAAIDTLMAKFNLQDQMSENKSHGSVLLLTNNNKDSNIGLHSADLQISKIKSRKVLIMSPYLIDIVGSTDN